MNCAQFLFAYLCVSMHFFSLKAENVDNFTVRNQLSTGSLAVKKNSSISNNLIVHDALTVGKDETIQGTIAVGGTTIITTTVIYPSSTVNNLIIVGTPEQACIIFENAALIEKARICSSPIIADKGIFFSVNAGVTQNVRVTNQGSVTIAPPTAGQALTITGAVDTTAAVINGNGNAGALALFGNPPFNELTDAPLRIDPVSGLVRQGTGNDYVAIIDGGQPGPLSIGTTNATSLSLLTSGSERVNVNGNGTVTFAAPTSGDTLTVIGSASDAAVQITGASTLTAPPLQLINNPVYAMGDFALSIDAQGNVKQSTAPFPTFVLSGGQPGPITIGTTDATPVTFVTNSIARLSILATASIVISSNVGIGTSIPPIAPLMVTQNNPFIIGSAITDANPTGLYVQGRYVYITNQSSNTLQIFDVSNSSAPELVGYVTTAATPRNISVQGRYAYVGCQGNSNALQIFDVSNVNAPLLVGSVSVVSGTPITTYVQGRYAYTASFGNALQIIDIYNPTVPLSTGSATFTGSPIALFLQGRYAYMVNSGTSTLSVFDTYNPTAPQAVAGGSIATNGTPSDLYVQGRYAYVTNSSTNTLQVFDVANPAAPVAISGALITTAGSPQALFVQEPYAYVINSGATNTLQIFDISQMVPPATPVLVGTISLGGLIPRAIFVQGRYAYITVAGSTNYLEIIDLGGAYLQQLEIGGMQVGTLQTRGNVVVNNDLTVQGSMTVGQSLQVTDNVGVMGSFSQVSDARKKIKLSGITKALSFVKKLQPVEFCWTQKAQQEHVCLDDKKHVGFLAQEVQEVLPSLVTQREDGVYTLEYSGFIPLLVAAAQEQEKEIIEQEKALSFYQKALENNKELIRQAQRLLR